MKEYYRMRVYPKSHNGGDLIGIYLFSDDLNESDMEKKASESDYYKTAFVSHSDIADAKIDIFNYNQKNDFCGNAVVAALSLLRDKNFIKNGLIFYEYNKQANPAIIHEDAVYIEHQKPDYHEYVPIDEIKHCFNDIIFHKTLKPQIIKTHYKELILPVESLSILDQLMPVDDKIIDLSKKYNIKGIHAFAFNDHELPYGRNFIPITGVHEESVTTTSNGALACYLYKHHKKQNDFIFKQGFSTHRNSEIHVVINARNNIINSVWTGGHAFQVANKINKNFLAKECT